MKARWICWLALLTTSCVSRGKYDEALKSAADARADAQRASEERAARDREHDAKAAEWATQLQGVTTNLQTQSARNTELKLALVESGLAAGYSRLRIQELRKAREAAEARAALFRELALKLSRMMGDCEITVSVRDGRMVLALPADVLFDSGRTEIKKAGRAVLEETAAVLIAVPRQFQIAGHTDNVPIKAGRFRSNWELSSARAIEVVHFLTDRGVEPGEVSAAGYAEFDPVASNQTEEGRRQNRRIEITLQPNIDELVVVPESH